MMNVVFTPGQELKELGVKYSPKAQLGRPVNPKSKRQERLAKAPGRKTGRPINPKSKRQERLREQAAMAALGIKPKRGRPVNPKSKRQQALAAKAEAQAAKAAEAKA